MTIQKFLPLLCITNVSGILVHPEASVIDDPQYTTNLALKKYSPLWWVQHQSKDLYDKLLVNTFNVIDPDADDEKLSGKFPDERALIAYNNSAINDISMIWRLFPFSPTPEGFDFWERECRLVDETRGNWMNQEIDQLSKSDFSKVDHLDKMLKVNADCQIPFCQNVYMSLLKRNKLAPSDDVWFDIIKSPSILVGAFDWNTTDEGAQYWINIHKGLVLQNSSLFPLLPKVEINRN